MFELKNANGFTARFLENGSVKSITHNNILVNLILGNDIEGAQSNIFLRIRKNKEITFVPLFGPKSNSQFSVSSRVVKWTGSYENLTYSCEMAMGEMENVVFWNVGLKNMTAKPVNVDVVFAQDVGIADINGVRINEAYTSQYIDHTVFTHPEFGYVICSRQNQSQNGKHPWTMVGSFAKTKGYLTDGFQFFGLSSKETGVPEALIHGDLPNQVYQYEFAYPTLQSEWLNLKPNVEVVIPFFVYYMPHHPDRTQIADLKKIEDLQSAYRFMSKDWETAAFEEVVSSKNIFNTARPYETVDLTSADIRKYFGNDLRNVEKGSKGILSFFYGDLASHVVLKQKEFLVERPHGNILRSALDAVPCDDMMTSTSYIFGVFHSQLCVGNTSFNKILSVARSPLNLVKSSGQRIFMKHDGQYYLLGMPSAFEMGLNYTRWFYKGKHETIIIKAYLSLGEPAAHLEIQVEGNQKREWVITHETVLNEFEHENRPEVVIDHKSKMVELVPSSQSLIAGHYPEGKFYIVSKDHEAITHLTDSGIYENQQMRKLSLVVVETKAVDHFQISMVGSVEKAAKAKELAERFQAMAFNWSEFLVLAKSYWKKLGQNTSFQLKNNKKIQDQLNDLYLWYCQNAMIHYAVPHGLEQFTGAAWGVRDVCQGPVELFVATQNFDLVKNILKIVFSHQYYQTGKWPQWFMFDRYFKIQQHESHGDVIVWPLKAICDYIEAANDFSVLDEAICYTDHDQFHYTEVKESLFQHAEKLLDSIEKDFIPGTSLICYGEGDWDDTLQPADSSMRVRMVSSWTVELLYQTLKRFQKICEKSSRKPAAERLGKWISNIEKDFNQHLIKDGVVAGFSYFHENGQVEAIIHPSDQKTGIQYRLLPMTRGMISELLSPAQAASHERIIQKELAFPDGVRLMNRTATYHGGLQRFFKRAETASNFGREIGLQYVHANIRYVEAMAKLGKADAAYQTMQRIVPLNITAAVKNARTRQSNAYFSSSDGEFLNRYEAEQHFGELKTGKVKVKGGWRVYSSGPGIFIHTWVAHLLGIRYYFDNLVVDPVLPKMLNGLEYRTTLYGKAVTYCYSLSATSEPKKICVNGTVVSEWQNISNPYRKGGKLIHRSVIEKLLRSTDNRIDIYL